ncbi:MAG: DNA primase [Oscillospiraceae bacterium]|jgi:DNA primase|nr:DNA primase [Oscillospiraceae bacterium]
MTWDIFLQELNSRNTAEQVIGGYVNLKRRGGTFVGLCPFHSEKTPSFTVYPDTNSYYCFGCGSGGDTITFIKNAENLDYMEAVRLLAERAGLQVPTEGADDSIYKLKKTVYEINKEAARYFHSCLLGDSGGAARAYIRGRRLSMATVRHFGLGFVPKGKGLLEHLRHMGFAESDILQSELARKGEYGLYEFFFDRVMFPIIDLRGNVVGFSGRRIDGEKDRKYVNSADTVVFKKSRTLYGLNFAKNEGSTIILVEGNLDMISLHQAGFKSAVATCGTALTSDHARLLATYAKEVVVSMDADEAGQKAALRALDILNAAGINVRVLQIPQGKDPDDYIKSHGPERFKALLEGAGSDMEFRLHKLAAGYDLQDPQGLAGFLKSAAAVLAKIGDRITADLYAGRLAEKFSVGKEALLYEINKAAKSSEFKRKKEETRKITGQNARPDRVNPERRARLSAASAEEQLIFILFRHPDLFKKLDGAFDENSFVTDFNRRVFRTLKEAVNLAANADLSCFSREFSAEEMGKITQIVNREGGEKNVQRELFDCVNVINREKSMPDADDMTDEDLAAMFQSLGGG